ncbi:hypothetical protein [Thermococcus stetteri]|uniref:hypothetical protein n=1 Tax=Thermococcus stetteri TaxID=49900 RepID=UPI001AE149FA|nr:hypothetical protein [Thermococcus stetteri]MBP1911535.1 hypothetical protein [Thermococcus stetteri]
MKLPESLEQYIGRIVIGALLAIGCILPGEYYVRWVFVVALAGFLGWVLIGYDVFIPYRPKRDEYQVVRRPDFERALLLVKRAKKGSGREIAEEYLLEILHSITGLSFYELRANPPKALEVFYSSKDPYKGLKEALKILEAELNED